MLWSPPAKSMLLSCRQSLSVITGVATTQTKQVSKQKHSLCSPLRNKILSWNCGASNSSSYPTSTPDEVPSLMLPNIAKVRVRVNSTSPKFLLELMLCPPFVIFAFFLLISTFFLEVNFQFILTRSNREITMEAIDLWKELSWVVCLCSWLDPGFQSLYLCIYVGVGEYWNDMKLSMRRENWGFKGERWDK